MSTKYVIWSRTHLAFLKVKGDLTKWVNHRNAATKYADKFAAQNAARNVSGVVQEA